MDKDELEEFARKMGEPGPNEEAFYARRRVLAVGSGLDEDGNLIVQTGRAFVDFEASSLSSVSWPIEVGISWLENGKVVAHSRLIKPRPEWPKEDWNQESADVHGIPKSELEAAEPADEVSQWFLETLGNRVPVSDAPEFDQRWMDRLLGVPGPIIDDFDRLLWAAFSKQDGKVAPGRLHHAYKNLQSRKTVHRAGDDAANLCYAWRAGLGK